MAVMRRKANSGLTVGDSLIGLIVCESAQGEANVADDDETEPLGVVVGVEGEDLLIAGPGEEAFVLVHEDFEYGDSKLFAPYTDGSAAVFAPAASTVTTLTVERLSTGFIRLPYGAKATAGALVPCFVLPQLQVKKAS